ncbi:MAG: tetratricopeptide repeat protein [Planctomycetota bacterium]
MPAWAANNRVKAALLGGGLLVLVGGATTVMVVMATLPGPEPATLDEALDALDEGAYETARETAHALRAGGMSPDEPLGAQAFVLGAVAAYEADEAWDEDKRRLYLVATRYLEEARDLGFPASREGEGLFLLGRSLYLSGRMPACRPVLREALKANPRRETEIRWLLAAAYLEDANPMLPEALRENGVYLSRPDLSSERRHEGLLQRGRILLELGKTTECLATLNQIPSGAKNHAEAIVLRGWALIREARSLGTDPETPGRSEPAAAKYQEAIATLRNAQGYDTLAAQATRKAMYLIGICYQELGQDAAALHQFDRTRNKYLDTPEAQASDYRIAELSRRLSRDDAALSAYRRVLDAVTDVDEYHNPWLPLDDLRGGILEAYEHYCDLEQYEMCLQLTWQLHPVFTRARMIELAAETRGLWGRHLLEDAVDRPVSESESLRREGRVQLRRAGRAYEHLARLRHTTRHYPDDLWNAVESYRDGRGYRKVVELIEEYLKSQSRRRNPRALLYLGEAHFALGQIKEALPPLEECMEFHPRDAAASRARLTASRARFEQGEVAKARELLEENLYGGVLTPDSNEWDDSLYTLGHISHMTGQYEEAIDHLNNFARRNPNSPQAFEARYLVADSFRRRAKQAESRLEEDLVESARLTAAKDASIFFEKALDHYRQTQEALAQRQQSQELTRLEKTIHRNCSFFIGSVLFDTKQYEEAARAYSLAADQHQDDPESLEAYLQMARAFRRLDRPDEIKRTIARAKAAFRRIAATESFDETTIYTPEQWPVLLDQFERL